MLSLHECKNILKANQKKLTEEDVKKIKELFYFWAHIEYENYKKKKHE
jgi:hypothetical protein